MSWIIGIDPGKNGAVVLLDNGAIRMLVDMPTTGSEIDVVRLNRYLHDMIVVDHPDEARAPEHLDVSIVIEEQPFMPSEYGQFTKGLNFGLVVATAMRWDPAPVRVRAQVWKKHHDLIKKPKGAARDLALELWPNASHLLARAGDVDRADAALIARWAHDVGLGA